MGTAMEIFFQLLRQHNPWWFREEMILDDEKIRKKEINVILAEPLQIMQQLVREFERLDIRYLVGESQTSLKKLSEKLI